MNSTTTKRFWDLFYALPPEVRRQARRAFKLFQQNPSHPGLQFKQVMKHRDGWSVRINDDYRAIGIRKGAAIEWAWIGDHTTYEQIIHGRRP